MEHITWQPLGPLLKVKLLVGPTCKIPRSTQRSCSGIRRSPKMCQDIIDESYEIASMYGIFTYIYHKNQTNVGKYTIHGSYMKYGS